MKQSLKKLVQLFQGFDKGTVAVTFILALPVLIALIGIMAQYALINNARLTVDRAVQAAARSAMTSLPVDAAIGDAGGPGNVTRAAYMILESLSPASSNTSSDGQTVQQALADVGAQPPSSYAARYTYAQDATRITIEPIDQNGALLGAINYATTAAPRVRITVSYDFYLTVPVANAVIGRTDTISGITGRFQTFTTSLDVQLSHGREAPTDAVGEP